MHTCKYIYFQEHQLVVKFKYRAKNNTSKMVDIIECCKLTIQTQSDKLVKMQIKIIKINKFLILSI
jgi:hypothetical protein